MLVLVAISTGLRESTILLLRLGQIDGLEITGKGISITKEIPAIYVQGWQTKGKKPHATFLTPEAAFFILLTSLEASEEFFRTFALAASRISIPVALFRGR